MACSTRRLKRRARRRKNASLPFPGRKRYAPFRLLVASRSFGTALDVPLGGNNLMRPVYMISGGITKFSKANPHSSFRKMVKQSFDYAMNDVPKLTLERIDGTVVSYFSDHFTRQLKAGVMAVDTCGLVPKT